MHSSLWYNIVPQTRKLSSTSTLSTLQSTVRHSLCCLHWHHASVVLGNWWVGRAGCAGVAACLGSTGLASLEWPGTLGGWFTSSWDRAALSQMRDVWSCGQWISCSRCLVGLVWLDRWTAGLAMTSVLPACLSVHCQIIQAPLVLVRSLCSGRLLRRNGLLSAAVLPSIPVSGTSQYTGREMSGAGVGACHFCAAGLLEHTVRCGPCGVWHHSISVCMGMGLRGWGLDCLTTCIDNSWWRWIGGPKFVYNKQLFYYCIQLWICPVLYSPYIDLRLIRQVLNLPTLQFSDIILYT